MSKLLDVRPASFVAQLTCDRCGATAHHTDHEFHHFASLAVDATWGSPLGDGNRAEVDLCHQCLMVVLGPHLRMSEQEWAKPRDWTGFMSAEHRASIDEPADALIPDDGAMAPDPVRRPSDDAPTRRLGLLKGQVDAPDSLDDPHRPLRLQAVPGSWNFRLFRHPAGDGSGDAFLAIHEVFYGEGEALSWTEQPVSVSGETKEEVRQCLERMLACLEQPEIDPDS